MHLNQYTESYDRRDKPSVLVTSPSSPDRIGGSSDGAAGSGAAYANRLTPTGSVIGENSVGGRLQIKVGFESGTLQLILTVICAAGLTYRANGATRNPYVKVRLLLMLSVWMCLIAEAWHTQSSQFFWLDLDFFTSGSM